MPHPELKPTVLERLRFRHWRLVEAVARTGSVRRAADELHVTQPAATKILQDLETVLGVTLFERRPRAMAATEIGQFVVEHARRTLVETERFLDAVGNLRRGGFGALAIGAIMAAAPDILPAAVAELKRQRPLLTIRLLAVTSDQLMAALERRELDLVIGRFTEVRHDALFTIERLSGEELWAFAASTHPLAKAQTISLQEVGHLPWVLQPRTSPMRKIIDAAFADAGLPWLDNLVETTSIFATLRLVREAGMIAVLPSTIVAEGIEHGSLVRLPIAFANPLDAYGIITRRDESMSANAAAFIDALRRVAAERRHGHA